MKEPSSSERRRGVSRVSDLVRAPVRSAAEGRGFAQSRLLTHWQEIAGEGVAAICRPVDVSFAKGGLGATLTLLTTGAQAPMLEMQKEPLRARVNAVYGYNAIARIRITQTAPTGFAEGQADFSPAPRQSPAEAPEPTPEAQTLTGHVEDTELRLALARLAANVLSRTKRTP